MEAGQEHQHEDQTFCEDCYMDIMSSPPKACDPWAVHTAKSFSGQNPQLTEIQDKILSLIKNEGPLKAEEITARLGINEAEFRSNFVTLRHMELTRGFKKDKDVYYTLFSS